jgi:hypothetical protein
VSLRGRLSKMEDHRQIECTECGHVIKVTMPDLRPYNVEMDPEWWELRGKLLEALDRHPEAKADIVAMLRQESAEDEAS